ncbi:MAG: hypothetical protein RLZZ337_381 [Bacteroidota bacterium]|jgi:uncharacterized protein YdhG (YjbR/CyaY superfamily)
MKIEFSSVEEYIASCDNDAREILNRIRTTILTKAPDAVERISYGMPAYKTNGKPLVYFAKFKNHIGLYATPSGHSTFIKELSKYKGGKGSVQFPLDKPMPYDLIERIIDFRISENKNK